jgi:ferredoxin
MLRSLALFVILCGTNAFLIQTPRVSPNFPHIESKLRAVPLELEGQLDPSASWEVKFILDGVEKVATVSEGDSLLESAEKLFDDVPSSCRNGVCTTCAARVVEGRDSTKLAVHGLGEPQIDAGFVCSCQCFPVGPGVTIELNKYDEVYETQYGQYEKSYG